MEVKISVIKRNRHDYYGCSYQRREREEIKGCGTFLNRNKVLVVSEDCEGRRIFREAVLSTLVQYYFLDICSQSFYRLDYVTENNVTNAVWTLDEHLCLKDDDGKSLYIVRCGAIVKKLPLKTQVVTLESTVELNSTTLRLLLLADYDSIKLTDQSQITASPDPINPMAAIIDNASFALTTTFCYKFYPIDNPIYNCIEVTNIISKTAITIPYDNTAIINFDGAKMLGPGTSHGTIVSIYRPSIETNGNGNWINDASGFFYKFNTVGTYNITLDFTDMDVAHKDSTRIRDLVGFIIIDGTKKDIHSQQILSGVVKTSYKHSIEIEAVVNSTIAFGILYSYIESVLNTFFLWTTPTLHSSRITVDKI